MLLAAGACVNARDIESATPLALARELVGRDRSKGGGEDEADEQWTEGEDEEEEEKEEAGDEGAKAAASERKSVVMVGVRTRAGARELVRVRAADARC